MLLKLQKVLIMSNFKLVVKVELEEISEDVDVAKLIGASENASIKILSEQEACDINSTEHAVLSVSHSEIRRALSAHFEAVSKKKSLT